MKIAGKEHFRQSSSDEIAEASFEIARMISRAKKSHNIGETLVKPCMLQAASIVLGEMKSRKLSKIYL